jgi:hypothetical protein
VAARDARLPASSPALTFGSAPAATPQPDFKSPDEAVTVKDHQEAQRFLEAYAGITPWRLIDRPI